MKKLYPLLSVLFLIYWSCDFIGKEKVVVYHDNRQVKSEGMKLNNGERVGKWVYFYKNGNTLKTESYYKGKLNGFFYSYHQNGKKSVMGEYKNGVKVGNWFVNNEEGEWIIWKNYSKDGKLDGDLLFRNEKGELELHQTYSNGELLNSEVYTYNKDGKLVKVINQKELEKKKLELLNKILKGIGYTDFSK